MDDAEGAELARICRVQAQLASSEDTRAVLLALADLYDREDYENLIATEAAKRPE
jgi:hypothetical protein